MKILITGANGYLGGRLTEFFIHKKHNVIPATRSKCTFSQSVRSQPLDLFSMESLLSLAPRDGVVLHLAAADYLTCLEKPDMAKDVNVIGTMNLLKACKENAVKHFIYFSTIHVYGSPLSGELSEELKPTPDNLYAKTHLEAEKLVEDYAKNSGFDFTVLRLSNVVGCPIFKQGGAWKLVAHDLVLKAKIFQKIILKTSGIQMRNFFPLTDLEKVVDHLKDNPINSTMNIGSPKNITVIDLATIIQERIKKIANIETTIQVGDDNNQTANKFELNIDKLQSLELDLRDDLCSEVDSIINFSLQS